jgi:uncharacterized protein YacL
MPCNEADAVRSARLKGKKMAIQIKKAHKENVQVVVLKKVLHVVENEIIMDKSPFFYE